MSIAHILVRLIDVYIVLVLLRALSTWLQLDMQNAFVRLLCSATDPVLKRVRAVVPPVAGAVDISAVVIILGLTLLKFLIGVV